MRALKPSSATSVTGRFRHGLLSSIFIHPELEEDDDELPEDEELEEELHVTEIQLKNVRSQHLAGSPLQNG